MVAKATLRPNLGLEPLPSLTRMLFYTVNGIKHLPGGWERIRTSGTVARTHAFQASSLNHSDTHPVKILYHFLECRAMMARLILSTPALFNNFAAALAVEPVV